MIRFMTPVIAPVIAVAAALTTAQAQQANRITGVFATVTATGATLRTDSGQTEAIIFGPTVSFARLDKGTTADLKPGLFVGVGARPQLDGSQKAVQIVIFPESMRGTGEGHRAWGVMPEATMTNGAIAETVQSVSGPNFTLNYKDGAQKVTTPGEASILKLTLSDRSALTAGARGQVTGQKGADGVVTASRVTVWGEGVQPY